MEVMNDEKNVNSGNEDQEMKEKQIITVKIEENGIIWHFLDSITYPPPDDLIYNIQELTLRQWYQFCKRLPIEEQNENICTIVFVCGKELEKQRYTLITLYNIMKIRDLVSSPVMKEVNKIIIIESMNVYRQVETGSILSPKQRDPTKARSHRYPLPYAVISHLIKFGVQNRRPILLTDPDGNVFYYQLNYNTNEIKKEKTKKQGNDNNACITQSELVLEDLDELRKIKPFGLIIAILNKFPYCPISNCVQSNKEKSKPKNLCCYLSELQPPVIVFNKYEPAIFAQTGVHVIMNLSFDILWISYPHTKRVFWKNIQFAVQKEGQVATNLILYVQTEMEKNNSNHYSLNESVSYGHGVPINDFAAQYVHVKMPRGWYSNRSGHQQYTPSIWDCMNNIYIMNDNDYMYLISGYLRKNRQYFVDGIHLLILGYCNSKYN